MSYTPAKVNFTFYENATWTKTLAFTALNLTGYTCQLLVKDTPNGSTLMTVNGSISAGTNSTVTLTVSLATINALSWTNAVHELILTSGSGTADVILTGTISVVQF